MGWVGCVKILKMAVGESLLDSIVTHLGLCIKIIIMMKDEKKRENVSALQTCPTVVGKS